METKPFTIRIAIDLLEELRALAREHNRSINGEMITALQDYVARHKKRTGKG
jgi:predicted transcriptional regulator